MTSSRRSFLKTASTTAFAFQVVPSTVFGANERLQVACIGVGGKGAGEVRDISNAGADIVALCDVDAQRRVGRRNKDATEEHPKATFYKDFRMLLDISASVIVILQTVKQRRKECGMSRIIDSSVGHEEHKSVVSSVKVVVDVDPFQCSRFGISSPALR